MEDNPKEEVKNEEQKILEEVKEALREDNNNIKDTESSDGGKRKTRRNGENSQMVELTQRTTRSRVA